MFVGLFNLKPQDLNEIYDQSDNFWPINQISKVLENERKATEKKQLIALAVRQ